MSRNWIHYVFTIVYYVLTCQENNLNKYKFVTIAKIIMKMISIDEKVFRMRTSNLASRGMYLWINNPIESGIIKPTAMYAIRM